MSEVIAQQSPTIQNFALCISILDRFCAPLCEVLTDISRSESQEIIEWMTWANLFLVPLDGESKWYRYHHLFRDLLRQKLEHQRSSEEIVTLHIRASKWFNQNGFVEEAINHALSSDNMDQVAQLVEGHYREALNREQWRLLKRWLDLFPRQLIEKRVRLLLIETWVFAFFYKFDKVAANLEQIKAILDQSAPDLSEEEAIILNGEIATLWSFVYYWAGQGQLCLENAIRAIDVTPSDHAFILGIARCYQISAHQLLGQMDIAYQEIHTAQAEFGRYHDVFAAQIYLSHLIVAILDGNLRGAEEASTQLVNLSEPRKLYEGCGWAFQTLGYIHYQWNDLKAAERYFSKVLEMRYQTNLETQVHSSFGLALTYQAMGKHGGAAQVAEAAIELARETGNPLMLLETYSFESRLALLGGQVPNAEYWVASLNEPFYLMLLIEIPPLTLAAARIALGTPSALKEANDLLARLRQFVEYTHNKWRLIEVLALQALLHDAQDERETALALLEQAVMLAQPGGFIRLFVDLGSAMAYLLEKLHERGVSPDYIAQILAAFGMKDDADTGIRRTAETMDSSPLVESLTSRELEVLVLLDQHLTNKEIAEELVVSPSTVKTHTLNLYRKLHVHGRQQAVAKARELEILPRNIV